MNRFNRLSTGLFLLTALALPSATMASSQAKCNAYADVLLQRLQAEILTDLPSSQAGQIRTIAHETCISLESTAEAPPEGYADWFSYFLVNMSGDKPGNKRLKRLK